MLLSAAAIIIGFIMLIWSADRFVIGAAATARNFKVPPLIIGLTIVGFGTSAPEMMVAGFAAYEGSPSLAIGNAIGSNITNITLVLGVAAIISPLNVQSGIIKKELPMLLLVTLIALALMIDGRLSMVDGLILLLLLIGLMLWVTYQAISSRNRDALASEYIEEMPEAMPTGRAITWLLVGLVLLSISSKILVWGAVNIATELGVDELIIGLTIIAIGTSLPELAASVASSIKGEDDIALGNVVGSNMFNTLGVLALPGLMSPSDLPAAVLDRDLPIVIGLTILLFIMAYGFRGPGRLNRFEGATLFTLFIGYEILLYFTAGV